MDTIKYATFRYDTVEVENRLKNHNHFKCIHSLICEMKICYKIGNILEKLMHLEAIIGVEGQMWIH